MRAGKKGGRMIKWSINKKLICFLWLISGLTLCGCATPYYISKDINPSMFTNREEKLLLPLKAGLYLSDETRNYPVYPRGKLSKIVIGEALEKAGPLSLEKVFNGVSVFYDRNNVPQDIDRIIVIDFSSETESKIDFEPENYDEISCKTELLYKIYGRTWNLLWEGKAKGYDIQRIPKLKRSFGGAYGATAAAYHGFQEWKTTTRISLIQALEQINDQILTSGRDPIMKGK